MSTDENGKLRMLCNVNKKSTGDTAIAKRGSVNLDNRTMVHSTSKSNFHNSKCSTYIPGACNCDTAFLALSRSGLRETLAGETASVHIVPFNKGTWAVLSPAICTEDNDGNASVIPVFET